MRAHTMHINIRKHLSCYQNYDLTVLLEILDLLETRNTLQPYHQKREIFLFLVFTNNGNIQSTVTKVVKIVKYEHYPSTMISGAMNSNKFSSLKTVNCF